MRYINLRLTYLLTYPFETLNVCNPVSVSDKWRVKELNNCRHILKQFDVNRV